MTNKLPVEYHHELLQPGQAFLAKFHEIHPDLKLGFVVKHADIAQILEHHSNENAQPIQLKGNKQYELVARDAHTTQMLQKEPALIGMKIGDVLQQMYPTAKAITNIPARTHYTFIKEQGLSFTLQSKGFFVYDIGVYENGDIQYNYRSNNPLQDFNHYVRHHIMVAYGLDYEIGTAFGLPQKEDSLNESLKNLAYIFHSFQAQFSRHKDFGIDTAKIIHNFLNVVKDENHIEKLAAEIFKKYPKEYTSLNDVKLYLQTVADRAKYVVENGDNLSKFEKSHEALILENDERKSENDSLKNELENMRKQLAIQQEKVSQLINLLPHVSAVDRTNQQLAEHIQINHELKRQLAQENASLSKQISDKEQINKELVNKIAEQDKTILFHQNREKALHELFAETEQKHKILLEKNESENAGLRQTNTQLNGTIKSHENTIKNLRTNLDEIRAQKTKEKKKLQSQIEVAKPIAKVETVQENIPSSAPLVVATMGEMTSEGVFDKSVYPHIICAILNKVIDESFFEKPSDKFFRKTSENILKMSGDKQLELNLAAEIMTKHFQDEMPIEFQVNALKMINFLNVMNISDAEKNPFNAFISILIQFKPPMYELYQDIIPFDDFKGIRNFTQSLEEILKSKFADLVVTSKTKLESYHQKTTALLRVFQNNGDQIIHSFNTVVMYYNFMLKHVGLLDLYGIHCAFPPSGGINIDAFAQENKVAFQKFKKEYLEMFKNEHENLESRAIELFHYRMQLDESMKVDSYPLDKLNMLFCTMRVPAIEIPDAPKNPPKRKSNQKEVVPNFDPDKIGAGHLAWYFRDMILLKKIDIDYRQSLPDIKNRLKALIGRQNHHEITAINDAMKILEPIGNQQALIVNMRRLTRILYTEYEVNEHDLYARLLGFIALYQYDTFNETGKFKTEHLFKEILSFLEKYESFGRSDFEYTFNIEELENEVTINNFNLIQTEIRKFINLLTHYDKKPLIKNALDYVELLVKHQKLLNQKLTEKVMKSADYRAFASDHQTFMRDHSTFYLDQGKYIFLKYINQEEKLDHLNQLINSFPKPEVLPINIDDAVFVYYLRFAIFRGNYSEALDEQKKEELRASLKTILATSESDNKKLSLAIEVINAFKSVSEGMTENDLILNIFSFVQIADKFKAKSQEDLRIDVLAFILEGFHDSTLNQSVSIPLTINRLLCFLGMFREFIMSDFMLLGMDADKTNQRIEASLQFITCIQENGQWLEDNIQVMKQTPLEPKTDPVKPEPEVPPKVICPVDIEFEAFRTAINDNRLPRSTMMLFFFNRHKGDTDSYSQELYSEVLTRLVAENVITQEDELFKLKM